MHGLLRNSNGFLLLFRNLTYSLNHTGSGTVYGLIYSLDSGQPATFDSCQVDGTKDSEPFDNLIEVLNAVLVIKNSDLNFGSTIAGLNCFYSSPKVKIENSSVTCQ